MSSGNGRQQQLVVEQVIDLFAKSGFNLTRIVSTLGIVSVVEGIKMYRDPKSVAIIC
jgi:hypothetical protein